MNEKIIRKNVGDLLDWEKAHIGLHSLVDELTIEEVNRKVLPDKRSIWDVMEHMRIAQEDILEFIKNPDYENKNWPDDYWPHHDADEKKWKNCLESFDRDLNELKKIAKDPKIDLESELPYAEGYTYIRQLLLTGDHNSYHMGQIAIARKMIQGK